jgi:hypothetical protein
MVGEHGSASDISRQESTDFGRKWFDTDLRIVISDVYGMQAEDILDYDDDRPVSRLDHRRGYLP